jgi:hypothetical protein
MIRRAMRGGIPIDRNKRGIRCVDYGPYREAVMCHYRSYVSEDKARADAERKKELASKRDEVVGSLLRDVKTPEKAAPQAAPVKEIAPAK